MPPPSNAPIAPPMPGCSVASVSYRLHFFINLVDRSGVEQSDPICWDSGCMCGSHGALRRVSGLEYSGDRFHCSPHLKILYDRVSAASDWGQEQFWMQNRSPAAIYKTPNLPDFNLP